MVLEVELRTRTAFVSEPNIGSAEPMLITGSTYSKATALRWGIVFVKLTTPHTRRKLPRIVVDDEQIHVNCGATIPLERTWLHDRRSQGWTTQEPIPSRWTTPESIPSRYAPTPCCSRDLVLSKNCQHDDKRCPLFPWYQKGIRWMVLRKMGLHYILYIHHDQREAKLMRHCIIHRAEYSWLVSNLKSSVETNLRELLPSSAQRCFCEVNANIVLNRMHLSLASNAPVHHKMIGLHASWHQKMVVTRNT
jgi:hypothetical protein